MKNILTELSKPLDIADVDFRIQSINKGGYATILAYKDARVDMNRLDDVCGVYWQDKYELIDGQLFCSVGIKIDNEWIWRQDVGTESMTEQTKGRASDAFKRACFRWGIGRELYDYPVIQVKLKDIEFDKNTGKSTFNLKIKEWKWELEMVENKVNSLKARDNQGDVRFSFGLNNTTKKQLIEDSKDWQNVLDAIADGRIKSISQIEQYYSLSDELKAKFKL